MILVKYIEWHFSDIPQEIVKGWRNFLIFNLNYFSIDILFATFFSRWHRYGLAYGKTFSPSWYFEVFVFNTMSRVIGMILRVFLIVFGLFVEVVIFISGLIILIFWLALPFIIAFLIFGGLKLALM